MNPRSDPKVCGASRLPSFGKQKELYRPGRSLFFFPLLSEALHQRRKFDFRRGRRLGVEDHVVTWTRPERPDWMDEETYAQIPDELRVRELRVTVDQPGFRVNELVLVTTLLDAEAYTKEEVADLFLRRWNIEMDLRSIKDVLQMDVLRCKTPEMVQKEIWMHLLAYNLIRGVMAKAAEAHDKQPRELSFKGALQTMTAFQDAMRRRRPSDGTG